MKKRLVEEFLRKVAEVRGLIERINADGCFDGEVNVKTCLNRRGRLIWVIIEGGGWVPSRPLSTKTYRDANKFVEPGAAVLQVLSFVDMDTRQIDSRSIVTLEQRQRSKNVSHYNFRVMLMFK